MRAAGLEPGSVSLILVQSPEINAFVAGGQNVFLYTGLLMKSARPEEVVGVIAHELGHIRGGHLVRGRDAMRNASFETILGTVLGLGAAVLTGEAGAAGAVSMGMSSMAARKYMAFSRVQESSADQAALGYLQQAGLDASGLVSFMDKLADEELLPASQQSEYVRTHPLTRSRIEAMESRIAQNAAKGKAAPADWVEQHARMKAKLIGFVTPEQVVWHYSDRDMSIPARYARSIGAYRQNRVDVALAGIDALLKDEPRNPFFLELKGQMLVDFGRVRAALPFYKQAVELVPSSGLFRISYAHALIESAGQNEKPALREAITQLERAARYENNNIRLNRLMATAYGRLGEENVARVYMAEEAYLRGRREEARRLADAALATLPPDSRHRIKALDMKASLDQGE